MEKHRYYYGTSRSNVSRVKPGTKVFQDFHTPAAQALVRSGSKSSLHTKTYRGNLSRGRLVTNQPVRKQGYVYAVDVLPKQVRNTKNGAKVAKPVRVAERKVVSKKMLTHDPKWHYVNTGALHHRDSLRKRSWVKGQRIHHGAYAWGLVGAAPIALKKGGTKGKILGGALAGVGSHLIHDDRKDVKMWFERGPQWQNFEDMKPKKKRRRK